MVLEEIGTGPKLALDMRGIWRKKGTNSGMSRAKGPGGRGRPMMGQTRISRETPRVQHKARLELYLRLPHRRSSTRKKYRRKTVRRAFLGSGSNNLDTRILASLMTRVPIELTRVFTNEVELIH